MENKIPKEVIIIGGGTSIQEGIEKGLWNRLKDKFTIGCNSSFFHYLPTITTYVDDRFMKKYHKELYSLPLVIGNKTSSFKEKDTLIKVEETDNLFLLQASGNYYGKDSIKNNKIFSGVLVGIYSTTLALALGIKEIYYLGFDWTKKNEKKDELGITVTHYYQKEKELNHSGIGKTSYYDGHDPNQLFEKYLKEDIKIYNVSPSSNISCFTKINYDQFFLILDNLPKYNQDILRNDIKEEIKKQRENK